MMLLGKLESLHPEMRSNGLSETEIVREETQMNTVPDQTHAITLYYTKILH